MNERIQINGEQISDVEFAVIYERVNTVAEDLVKRGSLPWHPSFFEMLTAMAFEYFASAGVELAVLEVGMGGRLDATNIVEPCLSVITDIDLDHQKFLGDTLPEITHEKAGILRPNASISCSRNIPWSMMRSAGKSRSRREAGERSKKYAIGNAGHDSRFGLAADAGFIISLMGAKTLIASPLRGRHQLRNLALAITAAEELNSLGFKISARDIEAGVRNTRGLDGFRSYPR